MPKYVIKCQKFTEKQIDAYRIEVYSIWAIENMWCISETSYYSQNIFFRHFQSVKTLNEKNEKVDTYATKENSLCNVYKYSV